MLKQVLKDLNDSYLYDDLKGNFAKAHERILSWLLKSKTPAEQTTALLWKAQVHILRGELNMARTCLNECEKISAAEVNISLMIQTLRLLEMYERYNTRPDMAGMASTELSIHWRGMADLIDPNQRWEELRRKASDQNLKWQAWYIYAILCNLRPFRMVLESARFTPPNFDLQKFLDNGLQPLLQLKNNFISATLYAQASHSALHISDLYYRAGNPQMTEEFLAEAIVLAENARDNIASGLCLMAKADRICAPFSSPDFWNFALIDSSSETSSLSVITEEQEFKTPGEKAGKEAATLYREAEILFERASCFRGLGTILLRWGYLHFLQGDLSSVEKMAERAIVFFTKAGDFKGQNLAKTHLVLAKISIGNPAAAIDLAGQVGKWGHESGSYGYCLCLGILINRMARHQWLRLGHYENALAAYRAAKSLFTALGAPVNAAQNTADLAVVHQSVGERLAATAFFEQALDEYSEVLHRHLPAFPGGLQQKGGLQRRMLMLAVSGFQLNLTYSDSEQMERYTRRLEGILAEMPKIDVNSLAQVQGLETFFSGQVADENPELTEAMENWPMRQMSEELLGQSAVLTPLYRARKAEEAGNGPAFEQNWQMAFAGLQKLPPDSRPMFEAVLWAEKKDYTRATLVYRGFLERGDENSGLSGQLSRIMSKAGSQGQAEIELQHYRNNLQAFSMWVRIKQYGEAYKYYKKLEETAGKDWMLRDARPWQLLSTAGEMFEGLAGEKYQSSHGMNALTVYAKAIEMLESRRSQLSRDELKTAISADKGAQYLYFLASKLAMKMKNHELAYRYAQKGKARGILDLLAGNQTLTKLAPTENQPLRQWRENNARITMLQGLLARERSKTLPDDARVSALTAQLENEILFRQALEARLSKDLPDFLNAFSSEAPVLNIQEVAGRLEEGQLLIEYYFLGGDLLIWAINKQGLVQGYWAPVDSAALQREANAFRLALEQKTGFRNLAETLSEKLLAPISIPIKKSTSLIMAPFDVLHSLPFQALLVSGAPIGLTWRLSYIPSGSALQFLSKIRIGNPTTLLVLGNPTGDLPFAETEASYIAALYGATPLSAEQATEKALKGKIGKAKLLHFATHGYLSENSPLESAIALAKGEKLTLYELMGMEIQADLVVLSACNTARGETTGGDDVLGLTRGLLAAGAKNAMVSLWAVDDLSTSLLMGRFYTLLKKGTPPAEALLEAQKFLAGLDEKSIESALEIIKSQIPDETVRENINRRRAARGFDLGSSGEEDEPGDYSHPYYWAPFVLVGIN